MGKRSITNTTKSRYYLWHAPKLSLAFIRVPKAASSSVLAAMKSDSLLQLELGAALPAGTRVFATLRNPWDRMLSIYADRLKSRALLPPLRQLGFRADMSFAAFVRLACDLPDNKTDKHLRSQSWFLRGYEDDVTLIRVEDMPKAWTQFAVQVGLPRQLSRANSTKHATRAEAYTPELVDIVATRYAADVVLGGYEF
jgi:hypothetical protein